MNDYEKIYAMWRYEAMTPSFALRGGFRECGATPGLMPFDFYRAQSVAEHQNGTRALVEAVLGSAVFADVWSIFGQPLDAREQMILLKIAGSHDSPEAMLDGDIADDGQRNNDAEDRRELYVYEDYAYIATSGLYNYTELIDVYRQFQERNTSLGWLLYCADKTEAILTGLEYVILGHPGSIYSKTVVTEQDQHLAEICGTDYPCDIFLAGFLEQAVKKQFSFVAITELFINLIITARERVHAEIKDFPVLPRWIEEYRAFLRLRS